MKLSALTIFFVALCLGLTVAQVQLRVYRGTLVHSRVLQEIEILQDHLLGFDENNLGEVSAVASQARPNQPQRGSLSVSRTGKEGSGDSW